MRVYVRLALLLGAVGVVLLSGGETGAAPSTTQRVSVDSAGDEGNSDSHEADVSADGRYIAFESSASDLVQQDTNGRIDIFVRDRDTDGDGIFDEAGAVSTTRVSVSSGGVQATGDSLSPAISADGRYVAFSSSATNLVSGDTNLCGTPPLTYNCPDVFVRDRQTSTTERVSLSSAEAQANSESWDPAISGDGRYVAFYSAASNLVSGDTNNVEDIFVRDRQAGTTTRVSLASDGTEGNGASGGWPALSGDGRYVAFGSDASNLVAGDTNGFGDVFVRDRDTDTDGIFDEAGAVSTTRVSVDSAGTQSNGESYYAAISADGRYVAFGSAATNLVSSDTNGRSDVFVRDRQTSTTSRVSLDSADADSFDPAISSDGRYVAFRSAATNLVDGDTNAAEDVFLRDRQAGSTERVSTASGGAQGNGASTAPAVSGNGRCVAFESEATNLVPDDTNDAADVFVHDQLGSVGGIAELPDVSGPSTPSHTPMAALAAATLAILAAGAWYARRRSRRARP